MTWKLLKVNPRLWDTGTWVRTERIRVYHDKIIYFLIILLNNVFPCRNVQASNIEGLEYLEFDITEKWKKSGWCQINLVPAWCYRCKMKTSTLNSSNLVVAILKPMDEWYHQSVWNKMENWYFALGEHLIQVILKFSQHIWKFFLHTNLLPN